ncbi:HPr family phosphocarrier protein [Halanaerobacter jeridensis]|uniref:Phosphocarrier protein HPr n=1 Tax=Halanaerobacter jeridensis TaxID=706427 RepID=A0A939BRH7_9FIRM|nr:HPr family phosphocarrier protein [Halanaerobacter jeridensis]MBM7557364.1 phosphotransferase system HPr (HPr) family protein [Halanaerobacter jeridensis]
MINKEIRLNNKLGLHARPASVLVQKAEEFSSTIKLIKGDKVANVKSILGVLWLKVRDGDKLVLEAEGSDEEEAAEVITELFEEKLKELSYCNDNQGDKEQIDCISPDEMMKMLGSGMKKNLSEVG